MIGENDELCFKRYRILGINFRKNYLIGEVLIILRCIVVVDMTVEVKCSLFFRRKKIFGVGVYCLFCIILKFFLLLICIKNLKRFNFKNYNSIRNIWCGYMRKCGFFKIVFCMVEESNLKGFFFFYLIVSL